MQTAKMEGLKKIEQLSDHIQLATDNITTQDTVRVIKHCATNLKAPGSIYFHPNHNDKTIITQQPDQITPAEFTRIIELCDHQKLYRMLDHFYTMDDLKRMDGLNIKSTTRKTDLLERLTKNAQILFAHFKDTIISRLTMDAANLQGYTLLDADGYQLCLSMQEVNNLINGTQLIERWRIHNRRNGYSCYDPSGATDLFVDIQQPPETVVEQIANKFGNQTGTLVANPVLQPILERQRNRSYDPPGAITYLSQIDRLTQEFGQRKGSRKATLLTGWQQRARQDIIKQHLGKQVYISLSSKPHLGEPIDKETFEALATHLQVQYAERRDIVCRVTQQESTELIEAVWQEHRIVLCPVFIELNNGGETK